MHLLEPVSRPTVTQFTSTGPFGAFVISPVLSETLFVRITHDAPWRTSPQAADLRVWEACWP